VNNIGKYSMVGAGAFVKADVPDDVAVYGKGKSLFKRYFSWRTPFLLDGLIFTVKP
jgi:acetyltransferase-like isoleucine patch superfamily enzyme